MRTLLDQYEELLDAAFPTEAEKNQKRWKDMTPDEKLANPKGTRCYGDWKELLGWSKQFWHGMRKMDDYTLEELDELSDISEAFFAVFDTMFDPVTATTPYLHAMRAFHFRELIEKNGPLNLICQQGMEALMSRCKRFIERKSSRGGNGTPLALALLVDNLLLLLYRCNKNSQGNSVSVRPVGGEGRVSEMFALWHANHVRHEDLSVGAFLNRNSDSNNVVDEAVLQAFLDAGNGVVGGGGGGMESDAED